jgi:hypothetical protein
MKTLTSILVTLSISATGQISPDLQFAFGSGDLRNEYVIFWDLAEGSAIGENIEIKKNRRFEYSVFAIGDGFGYVKKSMAKGRFRIEADTLKITITKKKSTHVDDFGVFTLNPYYIIKTTIRQEEGKERRTLICLVPGDKAKTWDATVDSYVAASSDKIPEGQFWKEKIFTDLND